MTINELINELKHNSTKLRIVNNSNNVLFEDSVGVFKTSVIKGRIGNELIINISCASGLFEVLI
jgi:hypothetical protein